ncbi:MAG TPA: helix-turn-helix domain-containing protein [Gemmatimonadaceae bacterium]|nr:helix-turn-helix domain-containing protein [Gemmatimonadaceae bacterium]
MSAGIATVERIARRAIARVITHPIRNKTEFNEAREEWHALMDLDPAKGTPERDRFELLTILIAAYEAQHVPEPDLPSPQAVVRFMAEQKGLDQGDLAALLGGRSRLSEFLNEKRELSRTQIKTLRDKLGVPADLLIA